ncbi:aldehyde dehydrogenase [halophilic archaeon]|nr:aldehyde dehydrogenase [halophilic archaeon]
MADYSPTAEWNAQYIDGEWETPVREAIEVQNPATREIITTVPAGTARDVNRAFQAAKASQSEWADTPPQEREEVIQRVRNLLEENSDDIVETLIKESGSTRLKATMEVGLGHGDGAFTAEELAVASSYPLRKQGRQAESAIPEKENVVHLYPKGIVGVITPWNFPLYLTMRAVAPAIALGNAVVLKPAEDTPITGGLLHARLFEEAGLPPGVLNVVPGYGKDAGARTAGHPDLDVLSFTGSTEVGRMVAKSAVENLALPTLELGGNAPHVVLGDAPLDNAVAAGAFGSFIHQGQVCISINRHLVHESLYDAYVEQLAEHAASLTVGDPSNPETDIGPVINESQRDQMMEYIEKSVDAGATVETGGTSDNLFVEPTVLSGVTNVMPIAHNEHFGPIAPVIPFSDDDQAVILANDTEYGLTSSVYSGNMDHGRSVARRIEAGMVHVNDQPFNDEEHMPFGGVKSSGLGRYNGRYILRELTEPQWESIQHKPREYPL